MNKRVKQANEMLEELEEDKISDTIKGLVPLFYSLAISSVAIGVATNSLKDSNLI